MKTIKAMLTMLLLFAAITVTAQIVQWQVPTPSWGLTEAHVIRVMEHPVSQSIVGWDAQGKYVFKERIVSGNTTTSLPFTVIWRTADIDPAKIDQAQFIIGDVQDFEPEYFVLKPIWEIWILSEAPTVWDKKAPPAPTPATSGGNNINEMTYRELLDAKIPRVGPAMARRIIAGRPYENEADLAKVVGRRLAPIIAEQVTFTLP